MYIIDKNKDYYDYYSHVYGVDKGIVLDRRGSTVLTDSIVVEGVCGYLHSDVKWVSNLFIVLEIGYIQYLIRISNLIYRKLHEQLNPEFISCNMEIARKFEDHEHYWDAPLSIRKVNLQPTWMFKKKDWRKNYILKGNFKEVIRSFNEDRSVDIPILANTQITSLIDGLEIWNELQTYISSLNNDTDVSIPMTDVEKAEIHGFDKKTSFRHPIK